MELNILKTEIKHLVGHKNVAGFLHVRRQANLLAHTLAQKATLRDEDDLQGEPFPLWIVSLVEVDMYEGFTIPSLLIYQVYLKWSQRSNMGQTIRVKPIGLENPTRPGPPYPTKSSQCNLPKPTRRDVSMNKRRDLEHELLFYTNLSTESFI